MRNYIFPCIFLINLSNLCAQTPDPANSEAHCPDGIRIVSNFNNYFLCNTVNFKHIVANVILRQKGQDITFPNAVNKNQWSSDGSGSITVNGNGSAIYNIHPDDYKTGWLRLMVDFYLDPNLGCPNAHFQDTLIFYLMSFSVEAGDDQIFCKDANVESIEVEAVIANDNNPGFSNLFIWESSGTGSFSNAYIQNPKYYPSQEDKSSGVVNLTVKVKKPQCKPADFISDSLKLKFDICQSIGNAGEHDFCLFPNPTKNEIKFIGWENEEVEVSIYTGDGRIALTKTTTGSSMMKINLPPGLYKAIIRTQQGVYVQNLVVQ